MPEMVVGAVCDVKPERLQFVKETYGNIPCFESAEELMNSGLVDAVLIAVPHYSHPPLAMMAMKKGLHVMCEKPAGVYTKQVKEMNAVAKTCNVKFGMMLNQRTNRFEITLDKAKLVCENGELTLYENDVPCSVHIKTEKSGFKKPELTETKVKTDGENLQHIGVLRAFAAAILRNEPMVADGSEGINGLIISNAMHLSAFLNREVTLPIDDDLYYSELQKRVAASRRKTGVVEQVANTEGTY